MKKTSCYHTEAGGRKEEEKRKQNQRADRQALGRVRIEHFQLSAPFFSSLHPDYMLYLLN